MTIKNFLYRSFSDKPVLVIIHGFSERRWIPIQPAVDYFRLKGYVVLVPVLYDHENTNDDHALDWINQAKQCVEEALAIKDNVVVIGFSMGGVIAAHVASLYPVSSLFLLAPAFEYITLKAVTNRITSYVVKRQEPVTNNGAYIPLPEHFTNTFQEIVAICKPSIANVVCPIVFLHGCADTTIPIRSSEYGYEHVGSTNKKMFRLENVGHNILEDPYYAHDALSIIEANIKK